MTQRNEANKMLNVSDSVSHLMPKLLHSLCRCDVPMCILIGVMSELLWRLFQVAISHSCMSLIKYLERLEKVEVNFKSKHGVS